MIILRCSRKKTGKLSLKIDSSRGGTNRLLDEARISSTEVVNALNLIQVQDGLYKPRWGTAYYGADYGANPDGATEFLKSDQTTELITVAGGKVYKSTNGGSITEVTGATFTAGTTCYFMQIAGFLYIANGTDPLARYDGSTLTTYTEINAPTGLTGTATSSISAVSGISIYGIVTALNSVGETIVAAHMGDEGINTDYFQMAEARLEQMRSENMSSLYGVSDNILSTSDSNDGFGQ